MSNELLKQMFKLDTWEKLIDKAERKGINKKLLSELCEPSKRKEFFYSIVNGEYKITPPRIAKIPKDNGDYREVYINTDIDRVFLTLVNDALSFLFKDMIHNSCKSYQKGIGSQEVVQTVSQEITNTMGKNKRFLGYKADLSRYFDTVKIELIDNIFDRIEKRLGYENGEEPIMNILRDYYHNDNVYDLSGNLIQRYSSLKQGCAVASFLSNVVLYDIDKSLSSMDVIYYRYSDDMLIVGKEAYKAMECLTNGLKNIGLSLNPKKVDALFTNKWFSFLGFNLKGELITLSKNRVKTFQKEVEKRSIKIKNINEKQAKNNINNFLYKGDRSWADSCFGIINCREDINTLNSFVMDCIRACKTGKKRIGGLGSTSNLADRTILRGKGKNVKANKEKYNTIDNYISIGCLVNNYKINKAVYLATLK